MNNKGKITVFLCLLLSSMLLLGLTAVRVANIYTAKARAAMCARTAVSEIKSEYNGYIFEKYHILLFDKTHGGRGEAYTEELLSSRLEEQLGPDYQVEETAIRGFSMLTDDGCRALKEQISDYMTYAVAEYGAEQILESTGGHDGVLAPELEQNLNNAEDSQDEGGPKKKEEGRTEDPRDYASKLSGSTLLRLVMPEDMELSDAVLELSSLPSKRYTGIMGMMFQINNDFDSYNDLKKDLRSHGAWKDSLLAAGMGTVYARRVFNCATSRVNDNTVLNCELEYLICGKKSDYDNLEGAVNRIIAIRLPVNYSYLLSDSGKKSQIMSIAFQLSLVTGVPAPILKHLIAGAWAYVEAVAEIRSLLGGNKMSFAKNDGNWITDLSRLESSVCEEADSDEDGLCYEDYLMILLALNQNTMYYRMLDIMEQNVRQEDEGFYITNGAVGISVDIKLFHGEREIVFRETGAY